MFSYKDYCTILDESNTFSTNLVTPSTIVLAMFLDRVICVSSQVAAIIYQTLHLPSYCLYLGSIGFVIKTSI